MSRRRLGFLRVPGFSLVELLVVIAILSVLASFLLPVLQRARRAAMTVECLNRQKQIALATRDYAQDCGGLMPLRRHAWVCDKYQHGVATEPMSLGLLIEGGYMPDALAYCPTGAYTTNNYWYWRQGGYGYYTPEEKSYRLDVQLGRCRINNVWVSEWQVYLACYVGTNVDIDPQQQRHWAEGVNILRRDSSARFFARAPRTWPGAPWSLSTPEGNHNYWSGFWAIVQDLD